MHTQNYAKTRLLATCATALFVVWAHLDEAHALMGGMGHRTGGGSYTSGPGTGSVSANGHEDFFSNLASWFGGLVTPAQDSALNQQRIKFDNELAILDRLTPLTPFTLAQIREKRLQFQNSAGYRAAVSAACGGCSGGAGKTGPDGGGVGVAQ